MTRERAAVGKTERLAGRSKRRNIPDVPNFFGPPTACVGAPTQGAIDRERWRAIVIHDSGTPAGDVAAIERRHQQAG
ncbi:MAG: hypothetical protein ACKOJI_06900, partial [Phycisphaerales bacterium]